jgi:hypothetical protein
MEIQTELEMRPEEYLIRRFHEWRASELARI